MEVSEVVALGALVGAVIPDRCDYPGAPGCEGRPRIVLFIICASAPVEVQAHRPAFVCKPCAERFRVEYQKGLTQEGLTYVDMMRPKD